MAAIPTELIESELFGHERGAFTGAKDQRIGRFEQANGGTLFLDEIGDMPADAQTRLLRVLAEGEFFRVGGRTSVKVDVRIITATHRDLRALVANGTFREDLYHRLNVIRVHIPTLAERRSDIPVLAEHFLAKAAHDLGGERKVLRDETLAYLQTLEWPGNVRQLENTCNWLTVMAPGREIHLNDLPAELHASEGNSELGDWRTSLAIWARDRLQQGGTGPLGRSHANVRRDHDPGRPGEDRGAQARCREPPRLGTKHADAQAGGVGHRRRLNQRWADPEKL